MKNEIFLKPNSVMPILHRRCVWLSLALWAVVLLSGSAFAGIIQLPQTGQTLCYDTNGLYINCTGTGQDGDWKAGAALPYPRLTDGTGPEADCLIDNLTGRMWVKSPYITTGKWQVAIDYAKGLNLCGYTDWRMPNIIELESIVEIDRTFVCSNTYWSSTTYSNSPGVAWYLNYCIGKVATPTVVVNGDDKNTTSRKIWPVRGGTGVAPADYWETGQKKCYQGVSPWAEIPCSGTEQDGDVQSGVSWPTPRFSNNYNGTVTDNLTGLIWLKNASCFSTNIWQQALNISNSLASGSCGLLDGSVAGEWRLPNRKELLSLTDYAYYGPALSNTAGTAQWSQGDPFDNVMYLYWSSTTIEHKTTSAWTVSAQKGTVSDDLDKMGFSTGSQITVYPNVWPVRGGEPAYSDISVLMTDSPDTVQINQQVTYNITVINNGPDAAPGVLLTDAIPSGATYVSSTPSQGTCAPSGNTLSCSIGSMVNGATATISVVVIAPGTAGSITNTVTVSSGSNDPNATNNSASATTTVFLPGALSVTPSTGLISSGTPGGPFSPAAAVYTLQNTGGTQINWTASKGQSWVTLSPLASVALNPGVSTQVTVDVNGANNLAEGNYLDTVNFTNTTNGNGTTTRAVSLTISCTYSISSTSSPTIPATGGVGSVNVTTQNGCAWTIDGNSIPAWVHITSGLNRTGSGGVNYSVDQSFISPRTVTITIAGYAYTIFQAGLPGPEWMRQLGTSLNESAGAVAVDGSGNVYITGATNGSLYATSAGDKDIFLIKYDTNGNKLWTRQTGTSFWDEGTGVAVDGNGNVYVSGYTYGGLDVYANAGSNDILLIKYDTDGNKVWTRQSGTSGQDVASGVGVDTAGNIYIAGYTTGGLDGYSNSGSYDILLMKYDTFGNKLWTRQMGSPSWDTVSKIAVDGAGNSYLTGITYGVLDGNDNAGGQDIILVKYDADGNMKWTRQAGSAGNDNANGVAVDGEGNVYTTGYTGGGLDTYTNTGSNDIFLIKYAASGNKLWTRQMGTADNDVASSAAVDGSGNVYVTGSTSGGLDENTLAGSYDLFVVRYDTNGNKIWTRQMGSQGSDISNALAIDSLGNLYVTGYTDGSLTGYTNAGGTDIFLMKFASNQLNPSNSDISVLMTDSPAPVLINQQVTYNVTITNNGPDAASGVLLTDTIPSDTTYVSSTPSQGTCTPSGNTLSCSIGSMINGASATVSVVVTAPGTAGTITNTVAVSSASDDHVATNNSVSATTTVVSAGALSVTPSTGLTSSGTQGGPFSPASMTYTLQNTGGSPISWAATKGQTWVTLSSDNGTLASGASIPVIVSFSPETNSLAAASYIDTVNFTNITNGNGNTTRAVSLTVNANAFTSVTVLSPNGGETLMTGSSYQITWGSPASATKFTIQYSMNNGTSWKTIATNITGNSYNWTVPAQTANKPNSLIKVIGYNSVGGQVGIDQSNAKFLMAVVRVTSPNGGESWNKGTVHPITWTTGTSIKPIAKVNLYYKYDATGYKLMQTYTGSNPGTHDWTLPMVTAKKTACRVKVELIYTGITAKGNDVSNANFTILP
ncbi:MAG: SBBP repeat-containing protein [Nitrospirae bacterium]|nr:SBBP repeat-containing protein [Nitrospirota bacterium]